MKIRVDDIRESEKRLQFAEDPAEINEALGAGDTVDYRVAASPSVDVGYYRAGGDVFVRGRLEAPMLGTCARCLERYPFALGADFAFVLKPSAPASGGETGDEDLSLAFYSGDEIDLSPLVRESLLLALPTRPLCGEDCPGLCAHCGASLKTAACGCEDSWRDPRLEVLRTLKR